MAKVCSGTKRLGSSKESLTPLMQQYQDIKARYPGIIVFFRLGDFYEMFGDDAKKASKMIDVVLTQRQGVPMCGVPFHSVNTYLKKLIKLGEKVAVCEQLEVPGQGRGIVRRDVVRMITPGTILEDNLLESKQNNYLVSLCPNEDLSSFGLAFVDISTGEFKATQIRKNELKNEIFRLSPVEIIIPQSHQNNPFFIEIQKQTGIAVSSIETWLFTYAESQSKIKQIFKVMSLKPFGLENKELAAGACGGALAYFEKTQIGQMPPFSKIQFYSIDNYLLLDEIAIKNLELVQGLNSNTKANSLLEVIDATLTPMGARLIRQMILSPVLCVETINKRQKAVEFFFEESFTRKDLRTILKNISDIERILSRIASDTAGPRELISLKRSLESLPGIKEKLTGKSSQDFSEIPGSIPDAIKDINEKLAVPNEVIEIIASSIFDEPPVTLKDGGIIRNGYNSELDELRDISRQGKKYISDMENLERERTGIGSLKIGYTSVFGYYIEVTKSNLSSVPNEYIRKQTIANGERFITPELKSLEEKILSADEKIVRLEEVLFKKIRQEILKFSDVLQNISSALAELDVYGSMGEIAVLNNYCKPIIDESFCLEIKDGRHPVIENKIKSGSFIPNDVFLNSDSDRIILLTGPNMAGKSTYLRQVAQIVVLAQMGSFVPASSAKIGIIDRIFTRIGAADNLAGGESTFMVEMHETANILNQYTPRSLIILDEIGRGTSTYDGISIARAAVEYLIKKNNPENAGPKVLFATHYFELTDTEQEFPGIKNYNVSVKDWQGEIVFLHKIVPGAADRSYGIHVAELAGLPKEVIKRAHMILSELEKKAQATDISAAETKTPQLDFFASPSFQILLQLEETDINNITPIQALSILADLKKKSKMNAG